MRLRRTLLGAAIGVGFAFLVAGCGSDGREICGRSGEAELCLVGGPSSYSIEADGFRPGSDATMTVVGGGQPIVIEIDETGRVASDGAKLGILGGPDAQEVVVAGTTSGGEPAEFTLTVPAIRR